MKTILLTTVLVILANFCFAQSLWINDPQNWNGGQGTIEETKITYEPEGLYLKVDWEITFSAKGLNQFSESDTVEVVYNFTLPEGAVVNDSWLWFEDSILHALIIDRWSASQVYENIVNRRRDPSILYKNGQTNYELRIFPMAAKESRKVKLSFLLPAKWTKKSVNVSFLSKNLLVSKHPIETIDVNAKLSPEWKNPTISGEKIIPLSPSSNSENGITHQKILSSDELANNQIFELLSPLENGYYLNTFENGDEKFYQLALLPAEGIDKQVPQKVNFLIDFQKENSGISQAELLQQMASNLVELLTEKDSFNILYYDFEINKASENWISGDSVSIVNAINGLGNDPFVSYGNLPSLLASGIEKAQTETGSKIVLLANTDKLDDIDAANQLISDLLDLMDPVIPIYIGDFQTNNYPYRWISNYNYRGNEYFYRNLAKLTGGDYVHSFDGKTFSETFQNIFTMATNEAGLIDIHTTLENGFCYGRYILSKQTENVLHSVYLEAGRFSGAFPFEIEVSGLLSGEIFSKSVSIPQEQVFSSDSTAATFWYGKEIQEIENSTESYSLINDIIDQSIEKRILTKYTAFLCLEPGMMGELDEVAKNDPNSGWDDGGVVIAAEETEKPEAVVKVYPNPFTDVVNIEVSLPDDANADNTQLEIYDLFGKRIKVFNVEEFNGETEIRIEWDATDFSGNTIPKGTYLFVCTTPQKRISKKLILM